MIHILNIHKAIKKKTIKKLKDFIFENYYRRIGFTEENIFYSTKHKKIEATKKIFAKDY